MNLYTKFFSDSVECEKILAIHMRKYTEEKVSAILEKERKHLTKKVKGVEEDDGIDFSDPELVKDLLKA